MSRVVFFFILLAAFVGQTYRRLRNYFICWLIWFAREPSAVATCNVHSMGIILFAVAQHEWVNPWLPEGQAGQLSQRSGSIHESALAQKERQVPLGALRSALKIQKN